ncbi:MULTISPECIES: hypothetical protein [unclassified Lentimicrobium]|uniref:hypothetical protein n=1 Tax=unclassified Lentimicrobium TaxID=2677434 RepID=UPI001551DE56|nr:MULTISPECIES: hypothetical protein [unclassified Lentimicrobium]NPD45346.1 hypothetical protein [Lentimicrobium sp. S6]NPD84355.1 hypothetical protein [Lentimicrobium sp. L6]
MKNGNLYKFSALIMALVFFATTSFAQTKVKEEKKEQKYVIKVAVDEDGEHTEVDTIIIMRPDIDVDIESIMKDIEVEMELTKDQMREIHINMTEEMSEMSKVIKMELKEANEEVEKALESLQKELEGLDIEAEVRQRIDEALKTLEESDLRNVAHKNKIFIGDEHSMFMHEDSNVEYIIDGNDTTEVHTSMIWIGDEEDMEHHHDSDVNVWVEEDGEHKVIIKKSSKGKSGNVMFYSGEDGHNHGEKTFVVETIIDGEGSYSDMIMIQAASEKDFDKAVDAGLPVNENQRLEEMDINVNIDGDSNPVIGFKTNEEGKMKVTYYDENFEKIKSMKLKENNGMHEFDLNKDELKGSNAKYLLIEQNKKYDLLRLK